MVIRVSLKCEYGTFTLRKVTIVREMTNFFKFFFFFFLLIDSLNNKTMPG